jgi:signal peptidase I
MGKKIAFIIIGLVVVVITAVVLVRFVFFTVFYTGGDSMEPTLTEGSAVVVNRVGRIFERGDIVVAEQDGGFIVRRIVGLPKEEVEILDATIFVEGEQFREEYANGIFPLDEAYGFALKANEYLLFPDNRETADGRNIFPTNRADIVGVYSANMTSRFESIFGLSK